MFISKDSWPMSNLELIHYEPCFPEIQGRTVNWVASKSIRCIERLSQIFWNDGSPWAEANLWSLEMSRNKDVKLKTVHTLMEHLHKYANWLEQEKIDWRHFPKQKASRVLVHFRGFLVGLRDIGDLTPSTTSARMRAVIRFYRYAALHNFVYRGIPMWEDKSIAIKYFDSVGFQRTLQRITTDISIPNRARPGVRLEDGLLPISSEHMTALLSFSKKIASKELYLILLTAFFTGARLGTITTLRTYSLERSMRDPKTPEMWIVPIGPGTGISTKFDVSGELIIPDFLMQLWKEYCYSPEHLHRVIKAPPANKSFLFLTRRLNPYTPSAIDRQMVDLRRKGILAGLKFLKNFKFHQARATYGTWLMSSCLKVASVKASIEFVKRAMHHKSESTTFLYITFLEHTKAKMEISNAFTESFLGLGVKMSDK